MNKLIIPAIIGIFGLAPGTVTANAAESTTTSFSVQILKKKGLIYLTSVPLYAIN